jgi:hypothetical protein
VKAYEKALKLCEEYTDCVLYDDTRRSIVINVGTTYLDVVELELTKLGYKLIFTNKFNNDNTVTCTFSYDHTPSEC